MIESSIMILVSTFQSFNASKSERSIRKFASSTTIICWCQRISVKTAPYAAYKMLATTRRLVRLPKQQLRCLSSTVVDHYTSGWNIADIEDFTQPGKYAIQTYNKISPIGLSKFPKDIYTVEEADKTSAPAHVLVMRSHKLQVDQVDKTCRAIARCGAGTNNIPVAAMTEQGIPVFNTPGANANSVKELILAGLLLGSRRIVDGVNHMKDLGAQGLAKERVEKDKAKFGGREIKGRTLAVR